MHTIKITRVKEKYHDEHKLKVYVNGDLVERLKQNETKEITVQSSSIEIYAKSLVIYKSPVLNIECDENTEIEISMNPAIKIHPTLLVFPFLPIYIPIVSNSENVYVKGIASAIMLSLIVWAIIQSRRANKNGIIIKQKK